MNDVDIVAVICDQSCTKSLDRKQQQPGRWIDADGWTYSLNIFSDDRVSSKLIVSAVLVADAAIMRMMR